MRGFNYLLWRAWLIAVILAGWGCSSPSLTEVPKSLVTISNVGYILLDDKFAKPFEEPGSLSPEVWEKLLQNQRQPEGWPGLAFIGRSGFIPFDLDGERPFPGLFAKLEKGFKYISPLLVLHTYIRIRPIPERTDKPGRNQSMYHIWLGSSIEAIYPAVSESDKLTLIADWEKPPRRLRLSDPVVEPFSVETDLISLDRRYILWSVGTMSELAGATEKYLGVSFKQPVPAADKVVVCVAKIRVGSCSEP